MVKKVLKVLGVCVLLLTVAFVVFIGPWPTYAASNVEQEGYYQKAISTADTNLDQADFGEAGPLQAGWASARLTPPVGTPLAGYGDRHGKPSTGIHDELKVKALALSDGKDTVVITGSDMLIVPDNVADLVRAEVGAKTGLTPSDILFNASHTHSGPGAWAPGLAASLFGGAYDEKVMKGIAEAFSSAIIEAYATLAPAEIAHGTVDCPEYIRNRARDGAVDSTLSYLEVRKKSGARCHVVSYSAHATVLGGSNMEFSGDYPGYLQRAIETQTGGMAIFLSGAVGSMGPNVDGPDGFTRAQTMGEGLAKAVLAHDKDAVFQDRVQVASVGFPFKTPPIQFRLNANWRLSPYLFPLVGLDSRAWITAVRVGDVFLYGTPCDMSGEISRDMKEWAAAQGVELWVLSFDGDYVGYVSPYKYYALPRNQTDDYEMYTMSWTGPNQEAFFTDILHHLVDRMEPHGA